MMGCSGANGTAPNAESTPASAFLAFIPLFAFVLLLCALGPAVALTADHYLAALRQPAIWSAAWWQQPGVRVIEAICAWLGLPAATDLPVVHGWTMFSFDTRVGNRAMPAFFLNEIIVLASLLAGVKLVLMVRERAGAPSRR